MYSNALHKVVWVVVVVASAGLLAPPLFFIAAKKRVVSMAVLAVYAVAIDGSAVLGSVLGNSGNRVGGVLAITMIIAAVHAAIRDADWKPGR
ncbi:hypothetical protein WQO_17680 [Streptomyces globisporus C-1027]|uniref:Uncharacterized protein n=1 Tax=Streptomyces globisporus C-1027 TaxID=1172567 RepID=A0A0U3D340_STRGL|nr:hypothetical protein [Streptomyces globisporus]ALU94996.1 hypothetical protein WQO_17680 [Streptomyces globisporus C-1027]